MTITKVAFVHDYLSQYGGAEKTLEALLELYPTADIYTGLYNPKNLPETITSKNIIAPRNKLFLKLSKLLTFLMPVIFESFDLRSYDLIISDGTAWPKGVITSPNQLHIAYIHTPPRFLYKYSVETTKRNKWYLKPFVSVVDHFLRIWDFGAAQRGGVSVHRLHGEHEGRANFVGNHHQGHGLQHDDQDDGWHQKDGATLRHQRQQLQLPELGVFKGGTRGGG